MTTQARAARFQCHGCWLIAMLHLPSRPGPRGMLIVTGGPQYRVGSHRQFVLLARHMADAGTAVMRFDYRGMGDSEGEPRTFEQVQDDIAAAMRHFLHTVPELRELVLWGLCDGATAAAFHAARDARVRGLILLNPWVRTEQGAARATLRHYYLARVLEPDFWRKLAGGGVSVRRVLQSFGQLLAQARHAPDNATLPDRLHAALAQFRGQVMFILSGEDLTAREFTDLQTTQACWRELMTEPCVRQVYLPQANHTFSRSAWRDQVALLSASWIASW